jgi:hypothetical protein
MNGFSAASEHVLFPERVFDAQAFLSVRDRVLAATVAEPVVVDLRNTRSCEISALADLFGLLARLHGAARMRLRRGQQNALFEYLGLNRFARRRRWRWQ